MGKTSIQWTDESWNPVTGCTRVSPGCKNCYAFSLHDMRHEAYRKGKKVPEQYAKPFTEIQLFPERLRTPLSRKKPTRWFVNSMSDLFHPDVPFEFVAKVFAVMALANRHVFQVLTKRPDRAVEFQAWIEAHWPTLFPHGVPDYPMESNVVLDFLSDEEAGCQVSGDDFPEPWPLPSVWLGTSVENKKSADERIPHLLNIPAAVRFLSLEPLLEDLGEIDLTGIHWVITGGESGHGARPCNVQWIRDIRDQCRAAGVAFFNKQLGANVVTRNDMVEDEFTSLNTGWPDPHVEHHIHGFREDYQGADCRIRLRDSHGGDWSEWPEDLRVREFPQTIAGGY